MNYLQKMGYNLLEMKNNITSGKIPAASTAIVFYDDP